MRNGLGKLLPPEAVFELTNSRALGRFRRIPAAKLSAIGDALAEVGPIQPGAPEQEDAAGDHADGAVGPAVAAHQRRGDAEHAEADRGLTAEAAFGAGAAAAFAPEAHMLGEPGVGKQAEAYQGDEGTEDEWKGLDFQGGLRRNGRCSPSSSDLHARGCAFW
jgi:hypothetical protein